MEPVEMRKHRLPLDDLTAARLVAGRLDPADAPPGYGSTVELLAAARTTEDQEVDRGLLAAMVQAIDSSPADVRNPSMRSKLRSAKVATVAAALVLTSAGAAAAATGNLPDPAQDAVADVVERVGVDLPSSADDHPTGNVDNPTDSDQHGVDVSEVARDRSTTGREHGAAVSEVARAGHGPDAADAADDEGDDEGEGEGEDQGTNETERGRPDDPGAHGRAHAPEQAERGSGNAEDNPGSTRRP